MGAMEPAPSPVHDGIVNRPLVNADLGAIEDLHARVFGPGRFARTAYRVREGTPAISPFCCGAFRGDTLIASLRLTPVTIGGAGRLELFSTTRRYGLCLAGSKCFLHLRIRQDGKVLGKFPVRFEFFAQTRRSQAQTFPAAIWW